MRIVRADVARRTVLRVCDRRIVRKIRIDRFSRLPAGRGLAELNVRRMSGYLVVVLVSHDLGGNYVLVEERVNRRDDDRHDTEAFNADVDCGFAFNEIHAAVLLICNVDYVNHVRLAGGIDRIGRFVQVKPFDARRLRRLVVIKRYRSV